MYLNRMSISRCACREMTCLVVVPLEDEKLKEAEAKLTLKTIELVNLRKTFVRLQVFERVPKTSLCGIDLSDSKKNSKRQEGIWRRRKEN